MSPDLPVPPDRLLELARAQRAPFAAADPFPHVVLEDVFPPDVLRAVLAEFPPLDSPIWSSRYDHEHSRKRALFDLARMGPNTRAFFHFLNSAPFLAFLEELTGITGLIPDPHLAGGGLHLVLPGGFLDVHADFNRYDRLQLDRRLNALIYLNEDWAPEYGGALELWKPDMSSCARSVLPVFNRMVVFATTDRALHGHPAPLACPPDRARRSIATYYYTNGRPTEERAAPHSTLYKETPASRGRRTWRDTALRWAPPAMVDVLVSLRDRLRGK